MKQLLYMAGEKSILGAFSCPRNARVLVDFGSEIGCGHEKLLRFSRYTLIVWVFNPYTSTMASNWRLDTFQRFSAEPDTALDETEALSWA